MMRENQPLKFSLSTLLLVLSCLSFEHTMLAVSSTSRQHTSTWFKTATDQSDNDCDGYQRMQHNHDFSHYVLAQSYPPVACHSYSHFSCDYPQNVSSWIIHGLWPSTGPNTGPFCCDSDAGFDEKSLQGLIPRLVKEWTNLKKEGGFYRLWKHEWLKHGTCAPPSMHPEYNYLNQTLSLHENGLNIGDIFQRAGILPSNYYSVDKILSAFEHKEVVSQLLCNTDIDNKIMLTEVRICLDKSFRQMKCPWKEERPNARSDDYRCGSGDGDQIYYASREQGP